jgi:Mg2+-importing ATPase
MELSETTTSKPVQGRCNLSGGNQAPFSDRLLEQARVNVDMALKVLESRLSGLSAAEVEARIKRDGLNQIGREKRPSPLMRLWDNVKNPLVILLIALGVLS